MAKRMVKRKARFSQKTQTDPLVSKGLFVGIAFVLLLGILLSKVGNIYFRPRPSLPPQQTHQQELTSTVSPTSEINNPRIGIVQTFYTYIANQQFDLAYNLLSDTLKKDFGDYIEFSKGYATTVKTTLQEVKLDDEMQNFVRVRIVASDMIENKVVTRTFTGRWKLIKEEGTWKLDAADIQQIAAY